MTNQKTQRPRRLSRAKRLAFSCIAVFLGLALLEGVVSFVWIGVDLYNLWSSAERVGELKEEFHCEYDSELGWVNTPSTKIPDFYGDDRTITINADGVRGLEDYGTADRAGRFRAICLGDSFTLGYGVDDSNTFPQLLQDEQPDSLQIINMGQGGYSVGQCWLWLERLYDRFEPEAVICVFIVEDFRRLEVDRTANGYATPRFRRVRDTVLVENVPVPPKLQKGRMLIQPGQIAGVMIERSSLGRAIARGVPTRQPSAVADPSALPTGVAILTELFRFCQGRDCPMVLVLTPTLPELFDEQSQATYESTAAVLASWSQTSGVPFLDLRPAFLQQRHRAASLFLSEAFHHYSRRGNRIVAESLAQWLPDVVVGFPQPEDVDGSTHQ